MKRWLMILALAATTACNNAPGGSCTVSTPASCPTTPPSYQNDVAPILATYCVTCHVAGGEEPGKPLDTYAKAAALSGDVQSEVASCGMPPSGDSQPTDAQRETLLAWIVCGAPNN